MKKNIIVLGGGIAGCTTAIGLHKLGFNVTLLYKPRPFVAYEGFSEKTKSGLRFSGCENAAKLLSVHSLRNANWGENNSKVNHEFVVSRKALDEALIMDTKAHGVTCVQASVVGNINIQNKPTIKYKKDDVLLEYEADFIVDARGRFTPYKNEYSYGPKSYSILQELIIDRTLQSKTSIDSIENGWIWQANIGEGKAYIQLSCDEEIAGKINNFEDMLPYIQNHNINLWTLKQYTPKGSIVKRDSYSKIHHTIVTDKYILVGDAASSIDPLSGNGAFQALSMSSVAPYVVNTILKQPKNRQTAIRFYQQRVKAIFEKFSKVGKEFYLLEKRYPTSYWKTRQSWPKETSLDNVMLPAIEQRAVLKVPFICPQEILITKDNPMGVWLFEDIEIVNLAKFCLNNSKEKAMKYFTQFCTDNKIEEKLKHSIAQWMVTQKIL